VWLGGAGLLATRDFAWASLAEARGDSRVRLTWLTRLLQDGLAFLSGVPAQETALLEAIPLVGRVLETNYGLTFDVRSVPQPENLAYSDLGSACTPTTPIAIRCRDSGVARPDSEQRRRRESVRRRPGAG